MKFKSLGIALFLLLSACAKDYGMCCIEPLYFISDKEDLNSINKENIIDFYNKYERCPFSCIRIVYDKFDCVLNSSNEDNVLELSDLSASAKKKDSLTYSCQEWHCQTVFYFIVELDYFDEYIDEQNDISEEDFFEYKTISFLEEKVHLVMNDDENSSIEMTIFDLENIQTILDTFEYARYSTREDMSLIYSEVEELSDSYIYTFYRIYCVQDGDYNDWQYYLAKNEHTIYKEDGRVAFAQNDDEILVATDGLNLNS